MLKRLCLGLVSKLIIIRNTIHSCFIFQQGSQRLPKLCDELLKMIKRWQKEAGTCAVPVLTWSEMLPKVKKAFVGMDEDTLRDVIRYLHIMGEVSIHHLNVDINQ